jgi:predicted DNA-binding transcriptional regulator AlpA
MSEAVLDRKALKRLIPFSDPTIDLLEKQGRFPKRFKLNPEGKRVFWLESEVLAYIESCREAA